MAGTGHPCGLFGSSVRAVTPHSPLPPPSLLTFGWEVWEVENPDTLHAPFSKSQKLVSYGHCSSLYCKAQQAAVERADFIISCQIDPVPTLMEKIIYSYQITDFQHCFSCREQPT